MNKWLVACIALWVVVGSGCRHGGVKEDPHPAAQPWVMPETTTPDVKDEPVPEPPPEQTEKATVIISDEAKSTYRKLKLHRLDASDFDMPVVINDDVVKWLKFYSDDAHKTAETWLSRAGKWDPLILAALDGAQLPLDLRYVAMIESGFNLHAISSAKAVGMWQFMPATGRYMDLYIDRYVDERRDPQKATDAAIRYFTYLHDRFDDWIWVLAAYNGGEGRVARAIEKYPDQNYWQLCARDLLPDETCQYVPRFMAMMIIGHRPGVYAMRFEPESPQLFDTVEVPGGVVLDLVAECADATVDEIARLNPELRRHFTPPGLDSYRVKIPQGAAEAFESRLAALPKDQLKGVIHVVRSGETLSHIAVRYGVGVQDLMRANGISDARRVRIGTELTVPGLVSIAGKAPKASQASTQSRKRKRTKSRKPKGSLKLSYTVVKGDSLWSVARRHDVSVDEIKGWNGLSSDALSIGQRLNIYVKGAVASNGYHTVQAGDSLWSVSRQYGVEIQSLRKWNNLRSDRLYPGDLLKVQP